MVNKYDVQDVWNKWNDELDNLILPNQCTVALPSTHNAQLHYLWIINCDSCIRNAWVVCIGHYNDYSVKVELDWLCFQGIF